MTPEMEKKAYDLVALLRRLEPGVYLLHPQVVVHLTEYDDYTWKDTEIQITTLSPSFKPRQLVFYKKSYGGVWGIEVFKDGDWYDEVFEGMEKRFQDNFSSAIPLNSPENS